MRVKFFVLLDDKSRLITLAACRLPRAAAGTSCGCCSRPRAILLDNHGSFTGADARVACAQLGIRLTFARPYDGPSKGKIEQFWRTLRAHVLDRLDPAKVSTLDELNVREERNCPANHTRAQPAASI